MSGLSVGALVGVVLGVCLSTSAAILVVCLLIYLRRRTLSFRHFHQQRMERRAQRTCLHSPYHSAFVHTSPHVPDLQAISGEEWTALQSTDRLDAALPALPGSLYPFG